MQSQPSSTSSEPRTARNYGGRKFRYRWVDIVKPWQVYQLHAADAVAKQLGLPLNTFVTIAYGATFPGEAPMASAFKQAMKRLVPWYNGSRGGA